MTAAPPAILLHPDDNVLVCTAPVHAGDPLLIDGRALTALEDIPLGHKMSRHALAAFPTSFKTVAVAISTTRRRRLSRYSEGF